jgi:hypothetical protein
MADDNESPHTIVAAVIPLPFRLVFGHRSALSIARAPNGRVRDHGSNTSRASTIDSMVACLGGMSSHLVNDSKGRQEQIIQSIAHVCQEEYSQTTASRLAIQCHTSSGRSNKSSFLESRDDDYTSREE